MASQDVHSHRIYLTDTLRSHYPQLTNLLGQNVTVDKFSTKMFSSGLTVGRSQDVGNILDEFRAGFEIKTSVQELDGHFNKLLRVLENLGGPAQDLALQLKQKGSATPTGTVQEEGMPC